MSTRRGLSLVEMMHAVVLMGVVGSLTLQLLLAMFHANSRQQGQAAADFALTQLQISLRNDVHAAQRAEVDAERLTLALSSGERIVYTASARAVNKERIGPGAADAQVLSRERYSLPRGLALNWRTETVNDTAWLFVELRPVESPSEVQGMPAIRGYADMQIRVGRGADGKGDEP